MVLAGLKNPMGFKGIKSPLVPKTLNSKKKTASCWSLSNKPSSYQDKMKCMISGNGTLIM